MSGPQSVATLLDQRAQEHPDKTFLRFDGADTSYAEFAESTRRVAGALASLGVGPGDRVAILSDNRPEFLQTWFATAHLGAIEVPVNTALRGRFLGHPLADSGAALIVVEAALLEVLAEVVPDTAALSTVVVVGDDTEWEGAVAGAERLRASGLTVERMPDLAARASGPLAAVEVAVGSPAVIGYTSGTTGPAKGAVISHRAAWYAGDDARRHRGLGPEDVFSTTLPLFHLNAQHLTTIAVLEAGATLALQRRFSARRFWRELADVRATHVNFIGAMLAILASLPPSDDERSDAERVAFGGPLGPEVIELGRTRWNVRFLTGYGATEFGIVTYAGTDGLPAGSFGKPIPEFEVEIVDDDGQPVPVGVAGEIVTRPVRPDSMMSEYYGMPQKTVEATRNLWFHSGDMGRRDEQGFMYFVDRKKDALRRRGENISSTELERAIRDHPDVVEAVVVGVPSELSEDDVKVFLRLRPEATDFDPSAFHAWCADTLPRFMVPRYVEVVDDFPRTATQRVEKYRLRERPSTPATWDAERAHTGGAA